MFIGHFRHTLDGQTFRLIIPSKLREAVAPDELREGFVVSLGLDGCLALYTSSSWREMASRKFNLGETDPRMFQRMLFGTSERVHPDSQGRVVLPERLVRLVGLEGEVVIAGADDRIEIWPPRRWADIEAAQRLFYEELAKSYYAGGRAEAAAGPDRAARAPSTPAADGASPG